MRTGRLDARPLSVPVPAVGDQERDPYFAALLRNPSPDMSPTDHDVQLVRERVRQSRTDREVVEALRDVDDPRIGREVAEGRR
jgi:hypothetical protein